jgi:hypothetical protein
LSVSITSARLLARQGKLAESLRQLDQALKKATDIKLVQYQLLARLARLETETLTGIYNTGHLHRVQLQRDAAKAGFGLIARKAATLASAPTKKPD